MKDNDNADRTPRVVLGRAVPAGATVAYRVGDDGWDGWEIDVLEDPAAVLTSDELVAVLDEPEPRPWPSAPLIRVWEGSDDGVVVDLAPPQPTLPDLAEPSDAEVRAAAEESTTDLGSIRDWYAGAVDETTFGGDAAPPPTQPRLPDGLPRTGRLSRAARSSCTRRYQTT